MNFNLQNDKYNSLHEFQYKPKEVVIIPITFNLHKLMRQNHLKLNVST
jgi:hypothetical protein